MTPMNQKQSPAAPPTGPRPGIWTSWSRGQILGLFYLVLTGNFFFQIVVFQAVGGMFWPVAGGAVLGVFLPLLVILRLRGLDPARDFSLDRPPGRALLAAVLLGGATLVPTSLLAELSLRLSPADPKAVAFLQEQIPTTAAGTAVAILAVVLLGPLAEEILFRGLLHRLASGLWGPLAATAVSSLVFGIIHGEAWLIFGLIGVGVALAFVYETTGSVTACWVTHAVHNAISLFFMIRQGPVPIEPAPLAASDWLWAAASVGALVAVGRYMLRLRERPETKAP